MSNHQSGLFEDENSAVGASLFEGSFGEGWFKENEEPLVPHPNVDLHLDPADVKKAGIKILSTRIALNPRLLDNDSWENAIDMGRVDEKVRQETAERHESILRFSRRVGMAGTEVGYVNFEESIEDSFRAQALTDAIAKHGGAGFLVGEKVYIFDGDANLKGFIKADEVESTLLRYTYGPLNISQDNNQLEDAWWDVEPIKSGLGRYHEKASCFGEVADGVSPDLYEHFQKMSELGVKTAAVKGLAAKTLFETFDVAEIVAARQNGVFDPCDTYMGHLEGRDAFLVQEFIPMMYETRMIVTYGKLVTGAGQIEDHTPLDRKTVNDFNVSVTVEAKRGSGDIEDRPEIVDALCQFAQKVIDEYAKKNSEPLSFVTLDVAMTTDDDGNFTKPVIVELNRLNNFGLFGIDPKDVVDDLVALNEQGIYNKSLHDSVIRHAIATGGSVLGHIPH